MKETIAMNAKSRGVRTEASSSAYLETCRNILRIIKFTLIQVRPANLNKKIKKTKFEYHFGAL